MDCTLTSSQCLDIYIAINYLRNHNLGACQAVGQQALVRFNAEGYGYRPGNNSVPNRAGYVLMYENYPWQSTLSGFSSADPSVYITDFGVTQITEILGGTIAHEEKHQLGEDGPYHNTGEAAVIDGICQQA